MKKLLVICAAMSLLPLAACQDASASLKDDNAVVFKVGNTSVTKGQLYSQMFASRGEAQVIENITNTVAAAEIELTDDLKESAESTLSMYSYMYGDSFTEYLEQSGLTEEDYLNKYLIPSLQAEQLVEKYVEESFDSLVEQNDPIKATILSFSSEEDASKALSELKDGSSSPAEAAANNNSSSSGNTEIVTINSTNYDSTVLSVIRSASPDDGWTMVPSTTSSIYVIRVESNNVEDYRDEAVAAFTALTNMEETAKIYYFKKYNFHIYDIDLYNAVKADNESYIVQ